MRIDVLTLFPEMFSGVLTTSILSRALERGHVEIHLTNFRRFATDKHQRVDDSPYGGGGGMVLQPEPLFLAVESILDETGRQRESDGGVRVVLLCPQGERFTQAKAVEFSRLEHLVLLCGHYEGFDERVRQHLAAEEVSLGDFVLTGGEIPAMAVLDSVVRLLPGVLGNESSAQEDSYSRGLLEYPHYTRPADFRGWKVPEVLLSGNHAEIERWRQKEALRRTLQRRPELLDERSLGEGERRLLDEVRREVAESDKGADL